MNKVVIGIGSNIDPEKNIRRAKELLAVDQELMCESNLIETKPVGKTEQADFLNCSVLLFTYAYRASYQSGLRNLPTWRFCRASIAARCRRISAAVFGSGPSLSAFTRYWYAAVASRRSSRRMKPASAHASAAPGARGASQTTLCRRTSAASHRPRSRSQRASDTASFADRAPRARVADSDRQRRLARSRLELHVPGEAVEILGGLGQVQGLDPIRLRADPPLRLVVQQ